MKKIPFQALCFIIFFVLQCYGSNDELFLRITDIDTANAFLKESFGLPNEKELEDLRSLIGQHDIEKIKSEINKIISINKIRDIPSVYKFYFSCLFRINNPDITGEFEKLKNYVLDENEKKLIVNKPNNLTLEFKRKLKETFQLFNDLIKLSE